MRVVIALWELSVTYSRFFAMSFTLVRVHASVGSCIKPSEPAISILVIVEYIVEYILAECTLWSIYIRDIPSK